MTTNASDKADLGIYEICVKGHGDCQKCMDADLWSRCYYCQENSLCQPFKATGFLGPAWTECPVEAQRVATCGFSVHLVLTAVYSVTIAIILIGLITAAFLILRDHLRESRQQSNILTERRNIIEMNEDAKSQVNLQKIWDEVEAVALHHQLSVNRLLHGENSGYVRSQSMSVSDYAMSAHSPSVDNDRIGKSGITTSISSRSSKRADVLEERSTITPGDTLEMFPCSSAPHQSSASKNIKRKSKVKSKKESEQLN